MKAITIRQPWAALIALGVKRIETRSWSTSYRGPLAIHAGKAWPVPVAEWQVPADRSSTVGAPCVERLVNAADPAARHWEMLHTPLGAVVAVVDLVDVVPIVEWGEDPCCAHLVNVDGRLHLWDFVGGSQPRAWQAYDPTKRVSAGGPNHDDRSDQFPFGDFTPGRFAWLLDNVRPLDQPVPAKGKQGLWNFDMREAQNNG